MTPEQWRRIEALYHAARERTQPDRHAFVTEACAGDDVLQRQVETLLGGPASAEGVLDGHAMEAAAKLLGDVGASALTGRRMGVYQFRHCSVQAEWVKCIGRSTRGSIATSL